MEQQFALDLNNRCQFIAQDAVILFIIEIGIILANILIYLLCPYKFNWFYLECDLVIGPFW